MAPTESKPQPDSRQVNSKSPGMLIPGPHSGLGGVIVVGNLYFIKSLDAT